MNEQKRAPSVDLERLAEVIGALGHPIRLEIVAMLADAARSGVPDICWGDIGEICVSRLHERFALSRPALSHHLAVLRHAGVVLTRRDGSRVLYRVRGAALGEVTAALSFLAEGIA